MANPSPSPSEISIWVADFAKKAKLEPQAQWVIAEVSKVKPDALLSFKDNAEMEAALAEIAKSEKDPEKLEALKRLLNAKLQIQLTTATQAGAVVAEAAREQAAQDKKNVETLIRKIESTPSAETVAECVKLIEADAAYTPESKKEIYANLLRALLFSKGFGYRADLGKVVDATGKIDEARTQALAAISPETIRFTIHYMVSAKAKTWTPKMMANALIREFKIKLPRGKDAEVNRQAIHNSHMTEPYKSWLLSWATDPQSVAVSKAEADLAQRLQDESAAATARANDEWVPWVPWAPQKRTNGKMFPRTQAEYEADPSLYMTDAVKALGPSGILLGVGLLIFSNKIFSNKFTGFDLVAKLGATFLGLKFAGKSGLWKWAGGEIRWETNDTQRVATDLYRSADQGSDWWYKQAEKLIKFWIAKTDTAVNKILLWYYMSNYTVMEGTSRVAFSDAKVATLDSLDPNSTSSLSIQKSWGKPVELSDLREAKGYIEKLKTQRIADLKASGKTDAQAQDQLKQDMANMSLSHFTATVNTMIVRPNQNAPAAQAPAPAAPTAPVPAPGPAAAPTAPVPAPAAAAAPAPATRVSTADVQAARNALAGKWTSLPAAPAPAPAPTAPWVSQADLDALKKI